MTGASEAISKWVGRITPASPPPASPPFRQGRRCEKSVPVDPRSAVPLPDTTPPPPLTEAWPELGVSGGTWCQPNRRRVLWGYMWSACSDMGNRLPNRDVELF